MSTDPLPIDRQMQTRLAKTLFNLTWDYLERDDRDPEDDELMLHAAHASCFFWRQVGQPVHHARGQWQLSRVNAVLGRPEAALHHARVCQRICRDAGLGAFDVACAHEALARACLTAGDRDAARRELEAGLTIAETITDEEDRQIVLADLRALAAKLGA